MTLVITGYWSHLHRVNDIDIASCKFGQVQNPESGASLAIFTLGVQTQFPSTELAEH